MYTNKLLENHSFKLWDKERINHTFSKCDVLEFKNSSILLHIGYNITDPMSPDYKTGGTIEEISPWVSLYLPTQQTSNNILYRDIHSGIDEYIASMIHINERINGAWYHNVNSYGWESLEDSKELMHSDEIIQSTHTYSKEHEDTVILELEKIDNIDCYVFIGYDENDKVFDGNSRVIQYYIKNITGSKYLNDGVLIVSAHHFIHDHTHFRSPKYCWKKFPIIIPENKRIEF